MTVTTQTSRKSERGMSLIELMIAAFVLVVGMLGSLSLILMAIATNSRNKFDTTGTMLAQMVIEQINTLPTNTPVTFITMTDCETKDAAGNILHAATPHTVNVVGVDMYLPTGAKLVPVTDTDSSRRPGDIDFSEATPPANYQMMWHSCGDAEFDIRWNVTQVNERSRLITVAARQMLYKGKNANLYAPPVTLRTISGP